ncbi:MAG: stage sporulation protein [Paenibacillus sp.]|nr:stage sporulation protein [Paenibacillus sp.]
MKWVVATLNLSRVNRTFRKVRSMSRLMSLLAVGTLACFLFSGLLTMAQNKGNASSISSMKGMAANLSLSFFLDMVAMEMPFLHNNAAKHSLSPGNTANFLIRYATNINMHDPKSLMAAELPGLANETSALLYSGQATKITDSPADFMPSPQAIQPAPTSNGNSETGQGSSQGQIGGTNTGTGTQGGSSGGSPTAPEQSKQPKVFIYHSHNRESFLPELKSRGIKDPDSAYDTDVNITLVGKRLKDKLEGLGVPSLQSEADYPSTVKGFNYAKSYAYSAKTVETAMADNKELGMIFDIHRDSLSRDRTTIKIDGKDYAQVYFIVGMKNATWKQNSEFANRIHTLLEQRYPGISRGVYAKASQGNGEYNQHYSPNSILMEIGGPYNALDEMYRTADLLGDIIAEMIKQAEQAEKV